MVTLSSVDEARAWVDAHVGADNLIARKVSIVARWILTSRGYEILTRDQEPDEDGFPHPWHRVKVDFGKLICNCKAFQYSRYSAQTPKTCKHLVGNNGLDGVAGWLELEARRGDLAHGQEAIIEATRRDPHRLSVRTEHLFSELVRANEQALAATDEGRDDDLGDRFAAADCAQGSARLADASLGYKLEDYFNS